MDTDVEVVGLRREFPTGRKRRRDSQSVVLALDDVSFSVGRGEIHGLLGPNGAGKSTLCKVLSTVLLPTSGRATVAGFDVVTQAAQVRRRIGIVLGGERGLYGRLTARQTMRFWAALYQVPAGATETKIDDLLERFGLAARANDRVETFSRGMKQRVHLARGLVGDPQVLLLDEPTAGMDPVAAHQFRQLIREIRDEGRTVLLASHDMAEAETVCDRVTMINGGQILATEKPATLSRWLSRYERIDVRNTPPDVLADIAAMPGVTSVEETSEPGLVRIHTGAEGAAADILARLGAAGVSSVQAATPSLEEVYLHVMGGQGLVVR